MALATVAAAFVLARGAAHYDPFISDDALISLRYAERWLLGQGLTWDDYAPVEGYSNLLWIGLVAGLGGLGLDLIVAARVLGAACSLGALLAIASCGLARCGPRGDRNITTLTALALFAACGNVQVWTVGGLEQPLVTVLLLCGLRSLHAALACPGSVEGAQGAQGAAPQVAAGCLAGLVLTRPDGPLFAAAFAASVCWVGGLSRGTLLRAGRLVAPAGLAVIGQMAFRCVYYRDFVPNTARVKLPLSFERVEGGANYIASWASAQGPLLLFVVAACVLAAVRSPRGRLVLKVTSPSLLLWLAYVAFVGGDIFPAHRHMVVVTGMLCLTLALLDLGQMGRGAELLVGGAGLATALWVHQAQAAVPENLRAEKERWEWQCAAFAGELRDAFGETRPRLGVEAAGCLGYFSKLPAVDLLGLNDRAIARHRPAGADRRRPGHGFGATRADYDYVVERGVDLLFRHIGRNRKRPGVLKHDGRGGTAQFTRIAVHARLRRRPHWAWLNLKSALLRPRVLPGKHTTTVTYPGLALRAAAPAIALRPGQVYFRLRGSARLSVNAADVPRGRYRVLPVGQRVAGLSVDCGDGADGHLDLAAGEAVTCTLTGRRPKRVSLIRHIALRRQSPVR